MYLAPLWPCRWLSLLVALMPCAALDGQTRETGFVGVGDLLQRADPMETYLVPVCLRGRRLLAGEEAWLGSDYEAEWRGPRLRPQGQAWFADGALVALLTDLLGRDADELRALPTGQLLSVRGGLAAAVETVLKELRQRLPPVLRIDLQLVRAAADGEQVLLARTMEVAAGRRCWVSATSAATAIVGYGVEIAQGAQIANPIVQQHGRGAMVMLRPFVSATETEGWFELLVRIVDDGAEPAIDPGATACGVIDRLQQHVHEVAGIVHARLGASVRQRWQGPDGQAFELRLVPTWQVPPPVRPGGHELEYLPCWNALSGFRSSPWTEGDQDESELAPAEAEFEAALVAANIPVRTVESRHAAVALDADAVTLRALGRARHAASQPMAVRLAVFAAPAGSKVGGESGSESGRADAPADAEKLGEVELQTVVGSWACATAYEELSILGDWDVEVAQSSRIPEPVCHRLASGLFVNLRCGVDSVELDGELSWREAIVGRSVRLDVAVDVPGQAVATRRGDSVATTDQSPVHLPQDVVRVESAVQHRLPLNARLALRRDAPAVWRCASELLGPGRELIVTVRRVD